MKPVLLVDFGSTYTKATAVEAESGQLLGTAQSYTTVEQDISLGLEKALAELRGQTGAIEYEKRYACSSAAGGLRMIASGLVPSLTSEAAKRAALGAGAKVIRTYAYELTEDDTAEIAALAPDILLLCGGTDGGNSACALHWPGFPGGGGLQPGLRQKVRGDPDGGGPGGHRHRKRHAPVQFPQYRALPKGDKGGVPPPHHPGQGPEPHARIDLGHPDAHPRGGLAVPYFLRHKSKKGKK